jgi:hypothetical protein
VAWVQKNADVTVDYTSKAVLLGAGTLFLTVCGAPAHFAFPVLTYLLGGKELTKVVTDRWKSKSKQ